ncbi:kisspeptin 2 [Megalops cyprinoides]|uniref:kisspeptin 2 n=1 Tax=Megalops cyprinoides TaxID=118141 RepID=UPI001863B1F0|nr:kisspeptin 2 [Megalops cyprinoides]
MSTFALLLAAAMVCHHGTMGRSPHGIPPAERTDISGSVHPERELDGVRGHSKETRDVKGPNSSDQPNLCFFLKDSEIESCRLRFARNKFNINPFGLRFGKRDWSNQSEAKNTRPTTSKLLPYLMYLREPEVPV